MAQVDVVSALDGLGRSDTHGGFHTGDYERTSGEKGAERALVADFILQHFDQHNFVNMLSMPGVYWQFEQLFKSRHQRTHFVALERSCTTFMRSVSSMIGSGEALAVKSMKFGRGGYEYARTPAFPQHPDRNTAHSHRFLCMSSDTYVAAGSGAIESSKKERNKFVNKFWRRNAAWLDFTSGFCSAVDQTVAGLSAAMHPHYKHCPVAITVMYGRDIGGKQLGRLNHIHKLNPNFEPLDYWTYEGKGGTQMMTICGLLHRTAKAVSIAGASQ